MTIVDLITALPCDCVAGKSGCASEITGGYASDLLSNVMGQAHEGNVWVTMQGHKNIIAVASLAGLSAIVLAGNVKPDQDTLEKADVENIPLLVTDLPVFEFVGRLYQLGVKGI